MEQYLLLGDVGCGGALGKEAGQIHGGVLSGKGAQNLIDRQSLDQQEYKKLHARKRIFKREGRSMTWKRLKTRTTKIIKEAKITYFKRIKITPQWRIMLSNSTLRLG